MSYRRPKRPSSARRYIKQDTFSSYASCSRLRKLQSLLDDSNSGNCFDAVLCITGIDSRYNDGTRELVNYLLFGFFENRRQELESSGYPEETIDDLIILIRSDSVEVYCNPINYLYLLPYIAHWRNLHIHCLQDDEFEADEEAAEEFKISSFIAMVQGCKKIGIPFSATTGHHVTFDKMLVEKWPIVQAFALEGFGGGGFFTMKYEVVDVTQVVSTLYGEVDPVALEMMVTGHLPLFERQWKSMTSLIDVEGPKAIPKMTEKRLSEPFRSYFSHGRVGVDKEEQGNRQPFILFGVNTSKKSLQSARKNGQQSDISVGNSGVNGSKATHMVCQAVSPKGPLCCTRTYFFNASHQPYPVNDPQKSEANESINDSRVLSSLYVVLVEGLEAAIKTYANTLSIAKAHSQLLSVIQRHCDTAELPLAFHFFAKKENLDFSIEAYDYHGRIVPLQEGESCSMVKMASVTVYDIPSLTDKGKSLGSIAYAESFVESTIPIVQTKQDSQPSLDGSFLVLTSHIRRHILWTSIENSKESVPHSEEDSGSLGREIISGDTAQVIADTGMSSAEDVTLSVFENGVIFVHPQYGAVAIPKSKMSALEFYDGGTVSVMCLLIITYKPSLVPFLPRHLKTTDHQLLIAMMPKSKLYRAFFNEILHLWKEETQTPVLKMLEALPESLLPIHTQLQYVFTMEHVTPTPVSGLKEAAISLPEIHSFLDHLSVSSVGRVPVPRQDLAILLKQPYDTGSFNDSDEIIITILSGIPGSHKHNLCTTLTTMAKDQYRWVVLRQPFDNIEAFNPQGLQASLEQTINAAKKKKSATAKRKMRALVVTPGFTDIIDVVHAITSHPNPDVAKHLKIGAVTVCLDPLNMYIENRYPMPKVLDQCSQGWVNNILFTSSLDPKNPQLAEAQRIIRAVNSEVAFILAANGEVTRSTDLDLILSETSFTENEMIRARYLSTPGWTQGKFNKGRTFPVIDDLCLRFSQPLEKNKFLSKLRGLKASFGKHPFTGNIYCVRGRLRFTDSPSLIDVMYIPLSGFLSLNRSEIQPPPSSGMMNGPTRNGHENSVTFTGVQLQQGALQDWLRACVKPKPVKKNPIRKADLTKTDLKKIHTDHHLEPLPPGWFYNGNQFLSLTGEKTDTHPNMDEFVEKYLADANEKISKYNADIDAQEFHDLF